MNISEQQLEAIRTWAKNKAAIRSIYLFGSRVKGTARPDSDLDVAIEVQTDDEDAFQTYMAHDDRWEAELSSVTSLQVSVQMYHPVEAPRVYSYVASSGFKAFEREPSVKA